jgi:hypothetical protein
VIAVQFGRTKRCIGRFSHGSTINLCAGVLCVGVVFFATPSL